MDKLSNDDKAVNMEYNSPITFLGKQYTLGRTNKGISIRLKRLYLKESILSQIADDEQFEKEYNNWESEINKILTKIIKPAPSPSELEDVESSDIELILKEIERRKYRRRGISDNEIAEIEEADHIALMKEVRLVKVGADEDFQNQNME